MGNASLLKTPRSSASYCPSRPSSIRYPQVEPSFDSVSSLRLLLRSRLASLPALEKTTLARTRGPTMSEGWTTAARTKQTKGKMDRQAELQSIGEGLLNSWRLSENDLLIQIAPLEITIPIQNASPSPYRIAKQHARRFPSVRARERHRRASIGPSELEAVREGPF